MPASQDAEPRGDDPVIAVCLVVLGLFAWAIVSLPAGMKWERFLHWTGEALLAAGVLLAAKGISDVRRQWVPQQLGIKKSAEMWVSSRAAKCTAVFWHCWDRSIGKWPRLTKFFHLSKRSTIRLGGDSGIGGDALNLSVAGAGRMRITGGTTAARIEELEKRLAALEDEHDAFRAQYDEDFRMHRAAMDWEAAERTAADKRLDEHLANAVGGGLHLQTWGVLCLLAGTVLTAIW